WRMASAAFGSEVAFPGRQRNGFSFGEVAHGDDAPANFEEGPITAIFGEPDRAAHRCRPRASFGAEVAVSAAPKATAAAATGGGRRALRLGATAEVAA